MILKSIKRMTGGMALSEEADRLEARFGAAGAVRFVREKISHADRHGRQHLYRLHDEIVRRHPTAKYA